MTWRAEWEAGAHRALDIAPEALEHKLVAAFRGELQTPLTA
jgi:hypothetical protein